MTDNGHYKKDTQELATDATETRANDAGWVATFLAALKARFPAGYEDDEGFHFGAEPHHFH